MVVGAGLFRLRAQGKQARFGETSPEPWRRRAGPAVTRAKARAPRQKRESLGVSWVKESVHVESHAAN
jgi:hypothetical protein